MINPVQAFEDQLVNEGIIDVEQLAEIKKTFVLCDQDKNGQLSYDEVGVLMQKLCNRRNFI